MKSLWIIFLRAARPTVTAFLLSFTLCLTMGPLLYQSMDRELVGPGTVLGVSHGSAAVQLDSGEFFPVAEVDAANGDEILVYKSSVDGYVGDSVSYTGAVNAFLVSVIAGGICFALTYFSISFLRYRLLEEV